MNFIVGDPTSSMQLPPELMTLIDQAIWPISGEATSNSATNQRVDRKQLARLIPDESGIHFYSPPFLTILEEIARGSAYWKMPETVVDQIAPEKALILGDFGHGSDTVLALDYRSSLTEPSVMRLQWALSNPKQNNRWVLVSPSFGEFCRTIGLL